MHDTSEIYLTIMYFIVTLKKLRLFPSDVPIFEEAMDSAAEWAHVKATRKTRML